VREFTIVFLSGASIKVKADVCLIENNGALVLESRPKGSGTWLLMLAVAPGQWVTIVQEGVEMEGKQV